MRRIRMRCKLVRHRRNCGNRRSRRCQAESETSAGKEKVKAQPNGNPNYGTPATAKRSNGHGLFPIAIGRTRPEQVMLVVTGHGPKQVGAQGMGKGRAVDLHRDKGTGALACAVPASTNFSAGFGIAEQHAPVGCIVAVVRLSRDESNDNIEHEGQIGRASWSARVCKYV